MISNSAKRSERASYTAAHSLAGKQRRGCECKVGKDYGALRKVAFAQRLFTFAGKDEDRLRADRLGALQIAQRIADARYAGQIHTKAHADFLQHGDLRFAAVALRLYAVRTIEQGVDAAADLRQ